MTYYHVYDDFCKPKCMERDFDRFVVDHFCESIDNDSNRVLTVFFPID